MCDEKGSPDIYVVSYYFPDLGDFVQNALPTSNVIKLRAIDKGTIVTEDLLILQEKAEVLFCDLSLLRNYNLNEFKRLKWIQAKGAGVEVVTGRIDKDKPPDFRLTRISSNNVLMGEHVIAYILALEKNIFPVYKEQKRSEWKQFEYGDRRYMSDLSVCVLGAGDMGEEVARQCKHFGMTVYGVTRTHRLPEQRSEYFDKYSTIEDLPEVLSLVDYICCCLPGTPETTDLLSGDCLKVCKEKKPILINIGRGGLISETTIVTAIKQQWLGGAVLDVVPTEPLPVSSPLWSLPNVYISPHVAGYSRDKRIVQKYVDIFVENYRRYCDGRELINEVCFKKGY